MTLEVLVAADPLTLEPARDLLERAGHRVAAAEDAGALRRWLDGGVRPAVIVFDSALPSSECDQVMAELRSRRETAEIAVAVLAAETFSTDETLYLERGFDAVLAKPVDRHLFVRDVERLAGAAQSPGLE